MARKVRRHILAVTPETKFVALDMPTEESACTGADQCTRSYSGNRMFQGAAATLPSGLVPLA